MPPHKQARPLTEVAVRNLKPGTTLADVGDHRGLRVSKTKIGTTTFFYRYRSPASEGRLRQYQIGRYPAISLAGARAEHSRLKGLRDNGTCPVARRKEEIARQHAEAAARAHQERSEAFTVKRMIDAYLQGHIEDKYGPDGAIVRAGARKPKGQAETRRTLYNDAVRALGELSAESVTPRNICDLITEIVDRGANVQAGNVLRELTAAFDFSIGAGLPDDFANPGYQAKARTKSMRLRLTSKRGKRALVDGELRKLLRWLPTSRFYANNRIILLLTLYTGCRTGEICAMAWPDVDLESGEWHLRESKTDIPRQVQLTHQAIALLESILIPNRKFVFVSQGRETPVSQKQLSSNMYFMRREESMIDLPAWSPHDLRRTARTGLSRLGCPSEVAEAIIGHAKSGIEGVYDLHRYEAESRVWLQKWCDHLDALATG
jgi:integrase